MKLLLLAVAIVLLTSCQQEVKAPVPPVIVVGISNDNMYFYSGYLTYEVIDAYGVTYVFTDRRDKYSFGDTVIYKEEKP